MPGWKSPMRPRGDATVLERRRGHAVDLVLSGRSVAGYSRSMTGVPTASPPGRLLVARPSSIHRKTRIKKPTSAPPRTVETIEGPIDDRKGSCMQNHQMLIEVYHEAGPSLPTTSNTKEQNK